MRRRFLVAAFAWCLVAVPVHAQLADQVSRRQAEALFRTGQEYLSAEQFERAIAAFASALEKDRLLSIAHYGIGQANMNLRRYASAAKAYTDCIEAMRTLHDLQLTSQFQADQHRDEEIIALRSLRDRGWRGLTRPAALVAEQRLRDLEVQQHPIGTAFRPPAEVLLALGSAYFRNGDASAAESNWQAALEINPKYGEAHNNVAVIYMQTGRFADAEREVSLAEKNGFRVNPQFKTDLKDRQKASKAQ